MMRSVTRTAFALAVLSLPAATHAQQGNLLTCSSFSGSGVFLACNSSGTITGGQLRLVTGPSILTTTIRGTAALPATGSYLLSFNLTAGGMRFGAATFSVFFNDVLLTTPPPSAGGLYTFGLNGVAPTSTVRFESSFVPACFTPVCAGDEGAFVSLTNVAITAAPEPATLALAAGGLLVLGVAARRRHVTR